MGIGVYDISQNRWGSVYDASLTNYTIPASVVEVVGGSSTGGATFTSPATGWANNNVAKLFGQTASGSSSSTHLSGGTIAGIVIGVVAAVVACIFAAYFLIFRPRRARKNGQTKAIEVGNTESKIYEKEGENQIAYEKEGDEKHVKELPGDYAVELPGDEVQRDPRSTIGQN
jgi:hypothetical protein